MLVKFRPLKFTALRRPPCRRPDDAYGQPLLGVGRRGKYLLLEFESVHFAVHLMQGGRLLVDEKQSAKPRGGQARFVFDDGPALLLTEAGTERRAGVWCLPHDTALAPLRRSTCSVPMPTRSHPTAARVVRSRRTSGSTGSSATSVRSPGSDVDSRNEVCHRARISPFAMTGKLGLDGATKIVEAITRRRSTKASRTNARGPT